MRETDDQLSSIEDTKKDMESRKIMDPKLICGDVGYGKPRSLSGRPSRRSRRGKAGGLPGSHHHPGPAALQYLYPEDEADFPVRVDLMSRFKTPADIKKTLEGLKKGFVDIVIGTHRVLSRTCSSGPGPAHHRRGAAVRRGPQGKKIKQLKQNVDVLTLTATPIPRTLT